MFEGFVRTVRYASRLLARSPGFTATAILSLSIGIGANTAIFTAANALLLAPTPGAREMDQLVNLGRTVNGPGFDTESHALYADLRKCVPLFENVYAQRLEPLPTSGARLQPGATIDQAEHAVDAFLRQFATEHL